MSQYKLVPVEPNKAALIGEFKFKITETCPQCFYEEPRDDCEICEGANSYQREITVPWDTTKEMYRAMLEAAPVVNGHNQVARIAELEAEVGILMEDRARIDWLADPRNHIGNVSLPVAIVEKNLSSLRDAIDEAMKGGA